MEQRTSWEADSHSAS